ncbi:MAG: DUF6057 family protein [Alloprevotella sp.]
MTKSVKHQRQQAVTKTAAPAPGTKGAAVPASGRMALWTDLLAALALYLFFTLVVGDLLERTQQESFVTANAEQMSFLTGQAGGYVYLAGRWALTLCKCKWGGGLLLTLLLVGTACLWRKILGLPKALKGWAYIVPALCCAWLVGQGTNLYYKAEPSMLVLVPMGLLLASLVVYGLRRCLLRGRGDRSQAPVGRRAAVVALLVPVVLAGGGSWATLRYAENDLVAARVQLLCERADWDGIIRSVEAARRPNRTMAAFYAIALVQDGSLLENCYNIPYDYPDPGYHKCRDGNSEYALFEPECNFYAGLYNSAARAAMERYVMDSPNIRQLKTMTLAAVMNEEKALALKYLRVLEDVPFEGKFVEKYRPMALNPALINEDPTLAAVKRLYPQESHFEQQYRQPAFLGYNVGLMAGSDQTLVTSIAACLYSKDLNAFMMRAPIYLQKHPTGVPATVAQALLIASLHRPEVEQQYASVIQPYGSMASAFMQEVKPLLEANKPAQKAEEEQLDADFKARKQQLLASGDTPEAVQEKLEDLEKEHKQQRIDIDSRYKRRLREALRENWLGTYFYYYYCENNELSQTRKVESAGVN